MPELRVVVDEQFNRLLDKIIKKGLYPSKAELMRSATVYFLMNLGVLKSYIEEEKKKR
jgi:Arc/MetJ-type ribon-helix-helix transcriptional regulator